MRMLKLYRLVLMNLKMDLCILDNGNMGVEMDVGNRYGRMVKFMKVIGKII